MTDKKKGYWVLVTVFGILAMSALIINLLTVVPGEDQGMSMGGMMRVHHVENLKPSELLELSEGGHGMENTEGHHELSPMMANIALITTVAIYLFLPLLLGGSVLLLVLWI